MLTERFDRPRSSISERRHWSTRRGVISSSWQMLERGVEVHADRGAVVVERGAFALAVEFLPAKPLARRLRERRAGADHAGKGARARLGAQLIEDGLRGAAR